MTKKIGNQRKGKKAPAGFLALMLYLLLRSPLLAELSISASIDRNRIALNESAQVSVTISGSGNVPAPQMPDLPNFSIYSSGRSQNISFINGQVSSAITHTYLLTPKSTGKFTLGSFRVVVDGKTYQTEPIEIEVVSAQSAPPAASPAQPSPQRPGAFLKMTLDKSKIFVNEQAILTFRFYYRVPLISNPEYQPPDRAGFIFEDLPPPRNFAENLQGVQYQVTEIKTALFPTQPGNLTIPPAILKIRVEDFSARPFSDDFFKQFFGPSGREYLLKTNPVRLTVLPLPSENKPKNFSGGVGEFRISASADKNKLSVGEPLTLTVAVSGEGNIKSLSDPDFPAFPGFRKYDTASSFNIEKSKGRVEGSKVYKIILVPQNSGVQTIPRIAFHYFDLSSKNYKTIATAPLQLELLPAKSTGVVLSPFTYAPPEIQQIQQEIRYIKLDLLSDKNFLWVHTAPWFVPINLLPLLGLILAVGYHWRKLLLEKNPEKRRVLNAYRKAKKELAMIAQSHKIETQENPSNIFSVLQNYFADKMLLPPAGLSLRAVENYLTDAQISDPLIGQLKTLWAELELAGYAPAQFRSIDSERILKTVLETLSNIEKQLEKSGHALFRIFVFLIPCVLFVSTLEAYSKEMTEQFQEANRAYQEGQFQNAKDRYEELINNGLYNFAIEYNLGNAYYKLGRHGLAMAHWIRAWRMQPRDADVRDNLSLISLQIGEPFFSNNFLLRIFQRLFYLPNLNEISLFFTFILWLCCGIYIRMILKGIRFFQLKNFALILIFFLVAAWWGTRFYNERAKISAVITIEKAEVRSGPGKQFGVGFTIPEGRRILILNQTAHSEWIEIGIPKEGLKGWVSKETVKQI